LFYLLSIIYCIHPYFLHFLDTVSLKETRGEEVVIREARLIRLVESAIELSCLFLQVDAK
jgi:hypothetical protein